MLILKGLGKIGLTASSAGSSPIAYSDYHMISYRSRKILKKMCVFLRGLQGKASRLLLDEALFEHLLVAEPQIGDVS